MKKFFRVLLLVLVFSACGILSACSGDHYKNLAFEVYYSFTGNDDDWTRSEGGAISLHYGDKSGMLKLSEDGNRLTGTVFLKVDVTGVKDKYLDGVLIQNTGTGSSAGAGLLGRVGLVEDEQVVPLHIDLDATNLDGDVIKTSLRFTETASSKSYQINFGVTPGLTGLDMVENTKPLAVGVGGNTVVTNNYIKYLPANTLQKNVSYSLEGVGHYILAESEDGMVSSFVYANSPYLNNIRVGENGSVSVGMGYIVDASNYIARIKATSKTDSSLYTFVDVYLVPNNSASGFMPDVKFLDGAELYGGNYLTLYLGSEKENFGVSSLRVTPPSARSNVYFSGLAQTALPSEVAGYKLNVYVDGVKYDFDRLGNNSNTGINGLAVEREDLEDKTNFKFTALSVGSGLNNVEFRYELDGLSFNNASNVAVYSSSIVIYKENLPSGMIVNRQYSGNAVSETITKDSVIDADVYSTDTTLKLTFTALNSDNESGSNFVFPIEFNTSELQISNLFANDDYAYNALSGRTLTVGFRNGVSEAVLKTRIQISPSSFNGKDFTEAEIEYVNVTINLHYIVTAKKVEAFVDEDLSIPFNSELLGGKINLSEGVESAFRLKVYYDGESLDGRTISLVSNNENIVFGMGGGTSLNLQHLNSTVGSDTSGSYCVYTIPLYALANGEDAIISVVLAEGNVNLPISSHTAIAVRSVDLADEASIGIVANNSQANSAIKIDVAENDNINFAVVVGKSHNFKVQDASGKDGLISVQTVRTNNSDYYAELYNQGLFRNNALNNISPAFPDSDRWSGNFSFYANNTASQALTINIRYFALNKDNIIVLKEASLNAEFAVFAPVTVVDAEVNRSSIGYLQNNTDARASINYYASNKGSIVNAPSESVNFSNKDGGVVSVDNVNKIDVAYNVGGRIVELENDFTELGVVNIYRTVEDEISGKIEVCLTNKPEQMNSITFNFVVKRFGEVVDVSQSRTINFKSYEKAKRVSILSVDNSIDNSIEGKNYIYLSTINEQSKTAQFRASAEWDSVDQGAYLRLADLDWQLYIYRQDGKGNFVYLDEEQKIPELLPYNASGVGVEYDADSGMFTVNAKDGGVYKLVVGSLDSYSDKNLANNEKLFDTYAEIIIVVSSGDEANPYTINKVEELSYLNNSDKAFVLNKDLVVDMRIFANGEFEFSPISGFSGKLSGSRTLIASGDKVVERKSAITLHIDINNFSEIADEYYVGLFDILDEQAKLFDFDVYVNFTGNLATLDNNAVTYIGALAGVNNGRIENVGVNVLNGNISLNGKTAYFGSYAGVSTNRIDLTTAKLVQETLTINSRARENYIGGVAGENTGEVFGGFLGKDSLQSVDYTAVLNMIVNNNLPSITNYAQYYVGGVAGSSLKTSEAESGFVRNMLLGGQIIVQNSSEYNPTANTYLGGVVANLNSTVENCAVLGLELYADTQYSAVAGLVARAVGANISDGRVIFANVEFANIGRVYGEIVGTNVAGIVGLSDVGTNVSYSTVESFVSIYENFYPLNALNEVAGVTFGDANINNSFVYANLKNNDNNAILLGTGVINNSYFIGRVDSVDDANLVVPALGEGTKAYAVVLKDNGYYSAWEDKNYLFNLIDLEISRVNDVSTLFNLANVEDAESFAKGVYYTDVEGEGGAVTFVRASEYVAGKNYFTFNRTGKYKLGADNIIAKVGYENFDTNAVYYSVDNNYLTNSIYNIYKVEQTTGGQELVEIDNANSFDLNAVYKVGYIADNAGQEFTTTALVNNLISDYNRDFWNYVENFNTIKVGKISFGLPYLRGKDGYPLMIVGPGDIELKINSEYVKSISSVYIDENFNFDIDEVVISETVLVNVFATGDGPVSSLNTHKLFSDATGDGLLSVEISNEFSTGSNGLMFSIVSGSQYAEKVGGNYIRFKGVSKGEPIVVKCSSAFGDDSKVRYAVFFTEYGASELVAENRNVRINNGEFADSVDYVVDLVASNDADKANIVVGFNTKNVFNGTNYNSIIKNSDPKLKESLIVEYDAIDLLTNSVKIDDVLNINTKVDDNLAVNLALKDIACEDLAVNFRLYLDAYKYFGGKYFVAGTKIELATCGLGINVVHAAESVDARPAEIEMKTGAGANITVDLKTSYVSGVDGDKTTFTAEDLFVEGNVLKMNVPNSDGLAIAFEAGDDASFNALNVVLARTEKENLPELFDVNIFASLVGGYGYNYTIQLRLKDSFAYRYITSDIKLRLKIFALSNEEAVDFVDLTLQPSDLIGVGLENYNVSSSTPIDGYRDYITTSADSSIIEPAGLGGVMIARLQPSYAKVNAVSIRSSALNIGNNENVYINFEQLVYDSATRSYHSIATVGQPFVGADGKVYGIPLQFISNSDGSYDGIIYIHAYLQGVAGLERNIDVSLDVTTNEGVESYIRQFTTKFIPGAYISTSALPVGDGSGAYFAQNNSIIDANVSLIGYQYQSNYMAEIEWVRYEQNGTSSNWVAFEDESKKKSDYIRIVSGSIDPETDSVPIRIVVANDVPYAFRITVSLRLNSSTGSLVDSKSQLVFVPVDYLLTGVGVSNLVGGAFNVSVSQNKGIELNLTTSNGVDANEYLFNKLIEDLTAELMNSDEVKQAEAEIRETETENVEEKLEKFREEYKQNNLTNYLFRIFNIYGNELSDYNNSFRYNLNNNKFNLLGVNALRVRMDVNINYVYEPVYDEFVETVDGEDIVTRFIKGYQLRFTNNTARSVRTNFTLNVYNNTTEDAPVPISTEAEFNEYMRDGNGGNYILMNDIVLHNYSPISTSIASFDGNNRIVYIESFAIEANRTNYGLFDTLSSYTDADGVNHKSILKNVIVSYGDPNSTSSVKEFDLNLSQNGTIRTVVFGGLVANNSGLIYNCDVMNFSNISAINIYVEDRESDRVSVTLGGLVGINSGIITNSRVGRMDYTRVDVVKVGEDDVTLVDKNTTAREIAFSIGNANINDSNRFTSVAAGFVGVNQSGGIIASSYVANTGLATFSSDASNSRTAGFVAENNGEINYSFVKALEKTINPSQPYSTGVAIENRGSGTVAGFVHVNSGIIGNSFANTEVKSPSNFVSGFVYENRSGGSISESYAACTLSSNLNKASAKQPFVGVDQNDIVLSNGELRNCYYFAEDSSVTQKATSKPKAVALSRANFATAESLRGFAFVQSNSAAERNLGVWNYFVINSYEKHILPELNMANTIAVSYRYLLSQNDAGNTLVYTNASGFALGTENNPYIIRDASEFNQVFTGNGDSRQFAGHVRVINEIDLGRVINTRTNFKLGNENLANGLTSIEGNGMRINNILLDNTGPNVEATGLFAEIYNAYIKNLNLNYQSGKFSTGTAVYSGGLAGIIKDSIISNLTLNGGSTTINGSNLAGGLAGYIYGNSKLLGITSNLNVSASSTSDKLYAGGIAGVLNLNNSSGYNLKDITIDGRQMAVAEDDSANIIANIAGGVAGYAGEGVNAIRLKFIVGNNNTIKADFAAGGLFGVSRARIIASQVAAEEDTQLEFDSEFSKYVVGLSEGEATLLDRNNVGNLNLVRSKLYAGGIAGVAVSAKTLSGEGTPTSTGGVNSVYSRAGLTGEVVGGIYGVNIASSIRYSYAVPFVNLDGNWSNNLIVNSRYVGGLVGKAYKNVDNLDRELRNYVDSLENLSNQGGAMEHVFASVLVDLENSTASETRTVDNIVASFRNEAGGSFSISSLRSVYSGDLAAFEGLVASGLPTEYVEGIELVELFDLKNQKHTATFQSVFGSWSSGYWSLNPNKYFPLLTQDEVVGYIPIYDEGDLSKILANPEADFMVMNDIDLKSGRYKSNYILNTNFKGRLVGNVQNEKMPVIKMIRIDADDTGTSGFFASTEGALISNIQFEYGATKEDGVIVGNKVSYFGGVSATDVGSEFNSVIVNSLSEADGTVTRNILKTNENGSITGFGGIIGRATDSLLYGCSFSGKVEASVGTETGESNIGGLIGYGDTGVGSNLNGDTVANLTITDCVVSDSLVKAETRFVLELDKGTVNLGGAIGKAENVVFASSLVGREDKPTIFNLAGTASTLNFGGAIGYASNNEISSLISYTNFAVEVNDVNSENTLVITNAANFAGLVGNVANSDNSNDIASCFAKADINLCGLDDGDNGSVVASLGVAVAKYARISQCVFVGNIYSEREKTDITPYKLSEFNNVIAGGVIGIASGSAYISQVELTGEIVLGAKSSAEMGGIVGAVGSDGCDVINIQNCVTAVRLVPVGLGDLSHTETSGDIYLGGLVGNGREASVEVNLTISLTSIITDSVDKKNLAYFDRVNALFGYVDEDKVKASYVYYSSDYALFTEKLDNSVDNKSVEFFNLSAYALSYAGGEGTSPSSWKYAFRQANSGGVWTVRDGVPYITSLQQYLVNAGVLREGNQYATGSVFKPQVDGEVNNANYTYYILNTRTEMFVGKTLNGMLFGNNNIINVGGNLIKALVNNISKHSAVANMHINISSGSYNLDGRSVVANVNNGIISNCSVQGNGIAINGETSECVGLIAGENNGLINLCYSSAEIVKCKINLVGVAYSNFGGILSCYFTGYINNAREDASETALTAAGISAKNTITYSNLAGETESVYGYIFNCYMAGVIVGFDKNSFSADNVYGKNNFIDEFANSEQLAGSDELNAVETSTLVFEGALKGNWRYALTKTEDKNAVSETNLVENGGSFGYNYSYPIIKFSRRDDNLNILDYSFVLYTGSGENKNDDSIDTTNPENKTKELNYRANTLLNTTYDNTNYNNAYKIPHFGVLSTINYLPVDLNYVVIYDMDGAIRKATNSYIQWQSIVQEIIDTDDNKVKVVESSGVFVSNKYLALNTSFENTTDARCIIKNFSGESLFKCLSDCYFGDIIFDGKFNLSSTERNSSCGGVIANEVGKIGGAACVLITNVDFGLRYNADVRRTYDDVEITNASSTNIGVLFGWILSKANVTINNLYTIGGVANDGEQTSVDKRVQLGYPSNSENNNLENPNATIYMGLLAGSNEGVITLTNSENLYIRFNRGGNGTTYAGGLVGQNSGDLISDNKFAGVGTVVNISMNQDEGYVSHLGGVVGYLSAGTIANIGVKFETQGTVPIAGNLGGIVAVVNNGSVVDENISYCAVLSDIFVLKNKVAGLIAGEVTESGTIKATGFKAVNAEEEEIVLTSNYSEGSDSVDGGVGGLIGIMKNSSTIRVELDKNIELTLSSVRVKNVGGLVGLYEGGTIDIFGASTETSETVSYPVEIKSLSGSENVGGAFGKVFGSTLVIDGAKSKGTEGGNDNPPSYLAEETGSWKFLGEVPKNETDSTTKAFATINVGKENKNIGGLIGKFEGASLRNVANYNAIVFNNIFYPNGRGSISANDTASNIGGVVGIVSAGGSNVSVDNLYNRAAAKYVDEGDAVTIDDNHILFNVSAVSSTQYTGLFTKSVGGAIGSIAGSGAEIRVEVQNIKNVSDVVGYQNVGGLIGSILSGNSTIIIKGNNTQNVEGTETTAPASEGTTEQPVVDDGSALTTSVNEGKVSGVISVGGAVGMINDATSQDNNGNIILEGVSNSKSVYGNANVGGLVGLSKGGELKTNKVVFEKTDDNKNKIKGIIYSAREVVQGGEAIVKKYMPANIGGLVGYSNAINISGNILKNIYLTSVEEGVSAGGGDDFVVSTISNFMAIPSGKDGLSDDYYSSAVTCIALLGGESDDVMFNEIKAGYGLLIGGAESGIVNNSETAADEGTTTTQTANRIIDSSLYAQIGVNVGGLVGYYRYVEEDRVDIASISGIAQFETSTNSNAGVYVDGAYNIGGVFGYLDNSLPVGKEKAEFTDGVITFAEGSTGTTLVLQNKLTGMYVGGLVGKMNGKNGDYLTNTGTKIKIDTSKSYYIGGLVGRYEVNSNGVQFNGYTDKDVTLINDVTNENNINEFGGLIGMLKVGSSNASFDPTIEGTHEFAFTVNTIENENYYDGETKFDHKASGGDVNLIAQAVYVNKDRFTISATSRPEWYYGSFDHYDTSGVGHIPGLPDQGVAVYKYTDACNPLNATAIGWAKEYTMFKTMQRCIPYKDNGGEWDAIAPIYDASYVSYVATGANKEVWSGGSKVGTITSSDKDHIYYTVYEEVEGVAMLYSSMGVASPYLDDEGRYNPPQSKSESVGSMIWSTIGFGTAEQQYWYLNIGKNYPGLKGSLNISESTEYPSVSNYYIGDAYGADGNENLITYSHDESYSEKHACYFVPKYYRDDFSGAIDTSGTWFEIKNFYDIQPSSGSMFEASGVRKTGDDSLEKNMKNGENQNQYRTWIGLGVDAVLSAATMGAAGLIKGAATKAAKAAVKQVAKSVIKKVAKTVGKVLLKTAKFALHHLPSIICMIAMSRMMAGVVAQESFYSLSANATLGYMGPSYMREITYKDGKLVNQTDDTIQDKYGNYYVYYSTIRPSDYYSSKWLVVKDGDNQKYIVSDARVKGVSSNPEGSDSDWAGAYKLTLDTTGKETWVTDYYGYKYYVYKNGVYYVTINSAEVETVAAQPYIDKNWQKDYDFVDDSGYAYVRGAYSNGNYSPEGGVGGNFLKKVDNKYVIERNGIQAELKGIKPEKIIPRNFVPVSTSKFNDYLIFTQSSENSEFYLIKAKVKQSLYEWYDYIKGAYYTAWDGSDEAYGFDGFVKKATFTKLGEDKTLASNARDGIDYIRVTFNSNTYYYSINRLETDSDANSENYTTGMSINHLVAEGATNPPDEITVNLYPSSFEDKGYNEVVKGTFSEDEVFFRNDIINNKQGIAHDVTFFYYEGGYITNIVGTGDNATTLVLEKCFETFSTTDMITGDIVQLDLYQTVYDSYKNREDRVNYGDREIAYKEIPVNKQRQQIEAIYGKYGEDESMLDTNGYLRTITIYDGAGNEKTVSYQEIMSGSYNNYYTQDITDLSGSSINTEIYKVEYAFEVVDGKLYMASSKYVIDDKEDGSGTLGQVKVGFGKAAANYNYNKVAYDKEHNIYTRYRYKGEIASGDYHLYNNGRNIPNAWYTTNLVETVRVVLGGSGVTSTYYEGREGTSVNTSQQIGGFSCS